MSRGRQGVTEAPASVVALAEARAAAKASRDFATADRLRNEIAASGWQVVDTPDGFQLQEKAPFDLVTSVDLCVLDEAITADVSVGLIIEGWWEDARECLEALLAHSEALILALDISGEVELGRSLAAFAEAHHDRIFAFHLASDPGWGRAARRLAQISPAPLHVLMDASTVLDGAALALLQSAFEDASVAAAGWRGALVDLDDNWRSVIDRGPGEVDVLLGYLMMVRRESLLATPYPHPKARFYRNADLELSLGLRAAGGRLVAMDLPVHQGRHHGYHDSDPEMRDRESKRTYDRILTDFRGRADILVPRR